MCATLAFTVTSATATPRAHAHTQSRSLTRRSPTHCNSSHFDDDDNGNGETNDDDLLHSCRYNLHTEGKGNSIADAIKMQLDPDAMKAPLAKFYIRSSHNTYLPGAQVIGKKVNQGIQGGKTSNQATEERCVGMDQFRF